MRPGRWLVVALLALASLARAASTSPSPPTPEQVGYYTQPLVKARLRLPESLQGFTVLSIAPTPDDAARFTVEVRFKARAPFGGVTEHRAKFLMKRTASGKAWVVTAE